MWFQGQRDQYPPIPPAKPNSYLLPTYTPTIAEFEDYYYHRRQKKKKKKQKMDSMAEKQEWLYMYVCMYDYLAYSTPYAIVRRTFTTKSLFACFLFDSGGNSQRLVLFLPFRPSMRTTPLCRGVWTSRSGVSPTGVAALHINWTPHSNNRSRDIQTGRKEKNTMGGGKKKKRKEAASTYVLRKSRRNEFETFWPAESIHVRSIL